MEVRRSVASHPIYEEFIKYYKGWKEYPDKLLVFCIEELNKLEKQSNPLEHLVSLPIAETLKDVTRLVVINWSKTDLNKNDYGRIIDEWGVQVKLHLQDDGKTLKVFYDSKRSS